MLLAVPKSIFSKKYDLYDDESHLTQINLSQIRERAEFVVDGKTIDVIKESAFRSDFYLIVDGERKVEAHKRSVWSYTTDVTIGGEQFILKRKNWYCRTTELWFGEQKVGEISASNWYSRKAQVDLPESIPLEIRLFFLIITIFYWNRDAAAASAS
jgi:hypothetical protein